MDDIESRDTLRMVWIDKGLYMLHGDDEPTVLVWETEKGRWWSSRPLD